MTARAFPASAQEAVSCEDMLTEAGTAYNVGRFQEAIDQASACLQRGTPAAEERQQAMLLQGRATFIMGRKAEAGEMLQALFQAYPDMTLDPEQEIAAFVALAEEARSALHAEPGTEMDSLGSAIASSEVLPVEDSGEETTLTVVSDALVEAYEAEVLPLPVGGRAAIQRSVVYPELAKANGTEGYVLVRFVVDPQGRVRDAKVMRGLGDGCDEVALQAVRRTRFTPGKHNGQVVSVKMLMSIPFFLPK